MVWRQNKKKRVTLSDVAQLADVSTMTVSKVIRNTGTISKPTRARVLAAIEELGYVPNRIAGSLSSQVNLMVGVIIPSLSAGRFSDFLTAVNIVLDGAGMHTLVGASNFHTDTEEELIRTMVAWQPYGLILTGGIEHSASTERILAARTFPIVQVWDNDRPGFEASVGFSHADAGAMMARHFIGKGFRRVGYVGAGLRRDSCARRRLDAFRTVLAEHGLPLETVVMEDGERASHSGEVATERLLEQTPEVDAIFYLDDELAVGGLTHLHKVGVSVPDDIAVAGFDGAAIGRLIDVKLTTIDTPRAMIGELAAQALVGPVADSTPQRQIDVELTLVEGNTT